MNPRNFGTTDNVKFLMSLFVNLSYSVVLFAQPHWSFQPLLRSASPVIQDSDGWCRTPIDSYILEGLHKNNLQPAPMASRETHIRRATLDLIGLPPALHEVDEFFADERPDSFERVVDRLLASPHYGERWARPWLDLCHYGDTDGHLTDQLRPVAWRYRDWVISALNSNLPFDEFTISQLAGDLVKRDSRSALPATEDPILGTGFLRQTLSNREGGADLEEYRVEQIVDRTSMVGTIWLGLTVGCARCHDHKYDPLTQKEFFQLYSYFDQADEINIDAPLPGEREAYLQIRPEYDRRRHEVIEPYRQGLTSLQKVWEAKVLHALAHPGEDHVWDRQWELLGLIWGGGLGEGQLEGTEIVKLRWENRTPRQQDDLLDYFLERGSVTDEKQFAELKLGELRNQLVALKKQLPQAMATRAPVMMASQTPRQTYLHERGEFRSPGPNVEPALPDWLNASHEISSDPTGVNQNIAQNQPSRLALAHWLVSGDHPLTARVTVNRMWQEFFGKGIVTTPDDFGTRGARPTHPQLLDWLAKEFSDGGWNVKAMHRKIVCSATYRQSSRPRPELIELDPGNSLLARQSSLRVPAETVRDSILAVSGLLSTTLGGPGVYPAQDERVTMEAFGSNSWTTSKGADQYRRSIYTFIQRTSPFAQSITFDAPSPQRICARRDRSNTPMQALTLLNDPALQQISGSFAESLHLPNANSDRERIVLGFRRCLTRSATNDELDRLEKYVEQQRAASLASAQTTSSQSEWADLASVLINLHEFIVRD
ncbi:MAG: DUF1549 and DUF1553 domain-containing protein [Schlesneria sp.]